MSKLRPAATLLLVRPSKTSSTGHEVAWVHRTQGLRFLGDFWVFPGGSTEKGESPETACLRETFEEIGVLVWPGAEHVPAGSLGAAQADLNAGRLTWPDLLRRFDLPPDGAARAGLRPCARWKTPPFGPLRFDTQFFLRVAGEGTKGDDLRIVGTEVDRAEWVDPAKALARWETDEALLAPPTRRALEALVGTPGDPRAPEWADDAVRALVASGPPDGEPRMGIDFRPGIRVFPVRTPTLPPATHTNCYIVGHGTDLVVIDPASPEADEQARLDEVVDDLLKLGHRVREVVLTHHHVDHSSGAEHLARRLGVPIAAHVTTAFLLGDRVKVDRHVEHGEVFDLPADRAGSRPRRLRAHLLEGHADGHLAFHEEVTNGVIAGDMVAGTGTIIIDPPEGKMALYLDSLRRLKALGGRVLYPAHGPPIGDPATFVDEYVAHRLDREAKVLAAVQAGAAPVEDLVPRAYPDVKPEIYFLAARSLLAHLHKLQEDGRVAVDGDVWRVA